MINVCAEMAAKKKKCPTKVHNGDCIASECMAWRWAPDLYNNKTQKMDPQKKDWCGLAGKP